MYFILYYKNSLGKPFLMKMWQVYNFILHGKLPHKFYAFVNMKDIIVGWAQQGQLIDCFNRVFYCYIKVYRIVKNFGSKKVWQIWRMPFNSPKFLASIVSN